MKSFRLFAALTVFASGASVVLAQDIAAEREATMKENARAFSTVNKMNRGQQPYDGAAAAAAFTTIATTAKHFGTLYPAGGTPAGRSLAAIWEKKADFDDRLVKLETSAIAAATEAPKGEAEFKAAFAAIAPQCGGCHEIYRGD